MIKWDVIGSPESLPTGLEPKGFCHYYGVLYMTRSWDNSRICGTAVRQFSFQLSFKLARGNRIEKESKEHVMISRGVFVLVTTLATRSVNHVLDRGTGHTFLNHG